MTIKVAGTTTLVQKTVRLDAEVWQAIREIAVENNISSSEVLRYLVIDRLRSK